jgi:DNA-directed RNA polymerase subunit beta'
MVLGVYYLTTADTSRSHRGDGRVFADTDEVELAYQLGQLEIHSQIKIIAETWYDEEGNRIHDKAERLIDTTVGRVIFNRILPSEIRFVNWELDKGSLKDLIAELYEVGGEDKTHDVADKIKDIGFTYATRSGYSIAVSDIAVPPKAANH